MKLTLLTYLENKKRDSRTMSRDMEIGYEICMKYIKEYTQPRCKKCSATLPNLRSKYCKPCSSLAKEAQARKYAKNYLT